MKVTMKRRMAGTVPRKLELVNVSCVWRHAGLERAIVVNHNQATVHISFLPAHSSAEMPPFWELEALIDQGLGRDLALDVMAARRMAEPAAPTRPASPGAATERPPALTGAHP